MLQRTYKSGQNSYKHERIWATGFGFQVVKVGWFIWTLHLYSTELKLYIIFIRYKYNLFLLTIRLKSLYRFILVTFFYKVDNVLKKTHILRWRRNYFYQSCEYDCFVGHLIKEILWLVLDSKATKIPVKLNFIFSLSQAFLLI